MDFIGLLTLVLLIALVGFVVYLITTHIPMPDIFKQVINVGVAVVIILYLLSLLTGHATLPHLPYLAR